jgi:hypothetical protein
METPLEDGYTLNCIPPLYTFLSVSILLNDSINVGSSNDDEDNSVYSGA